MFQYKVVLSVRLTVAPSAGVGFVGVVGADPLTINDIDFDDVEPL